MRFYFSPKVSLVGLVLISLMLRASYWQWNRHHEKQNYIAQMQRRLELPITPLTTELAERSPEELIYRRVSVSGKFDFQHEMLLRNRRKNDISGVHLLTPLKIDDLDTRYIVNRGFIPLELSSLEQRKQFDITQPSEFVAIFKEGSKHRFLAPSDPPTGPDLPWVERWLRVDLENMEKQLPYELADLYLEIVADSNPENIAKHVVTTKSGRDELLVMGLGQLDHHSAKLETESDFPIPDPDTVIPAGRHLGYVYEWGFMALVTFLICLILQMRPSAYLATQKED